MTIEENKFVKINLDSTNSMLIAEWYITTADMNDEVYKELFQKITQIIQTQKPEKWLGDTRNFAKPVTPALQEWIATELSPLWVEAGLKKMAMILPAELIANLSIQQAVEEIAGVKEISIFETRYFDNIPDAKTWLMS